LNGAYQVQIKGSSVMVENAAARGKISGNRAIRLMTDDLRLLERRRKQLEDELAAAERGGGEVNLRLAKVLRDQLSEIQAQRVVIDDATIAAGNRDRV
jgi:hypothetical protein